MNSSNEWPDPIMPEDCEDQQFQKHIDVMDFTREDLLTTFSIGIAKQVQFPPNTTFLHGLGVIASAMTKSFSYEYFGKISPVNLYVVTSQPPSTGKSGVNSFFADPVRNAFIDFNKKQKVKRSKLEAEIKTIQADLKSATLDAEIDALTTDLFRTEEKFVDTPLYKYAVSNTTPEALEDLAFGQCNTWNIISDEAGAINVVLGNMYNDHALSNNDIILQSWDGDWLSSNRMSRKCGEGYVRGSIAVIAQDETISTILEAGSRGNGVSERFLLYREGNILGERDHLVFHPVDNNMEVKYALLVNRLVFSDKTTFKFSDDAMKLIRQNKVKIEPHLKDGEQYSNNMLRGAVGKMDKQVMKISCVLHVIENWGKTQPITIECGSVKWAIRMYKQLMKMYIHAADSQGFIGDRSEIEEIIKQFRKFLGKKKTMITSTALRDYVKHRPIFKNRPKLATYLKDNVLPSCQKLELCQVIDNTIFINPKLGLL